MCSFLQDSRRLLDIVYLKHQTVLKKEKEMHWLLKRKQSRQLWKRGKKGVALDILLLEKGLRAEDDLYRQNTCKKGDITSTWKLKSKNNVVKYNVIKNNVNTFMGVFFMISQIQIPSRQQ